MTNEQGRAAVAYFRDALGLTNRDLARTFQDKVAPEDFVAFMNGDDTALSDAQKSYVGNEAVHWVKAEDLDREDAKRMGYAPAPGVREIAGI